MAFDDGQQQLVPKRGLSATRRRRQRTIRRASRLSRLILAIAVLSTLGLATASCGSESRASSAQIDATEGSTGQQFIDGTSALDAETVLHHWQALTAIRDGAVDDAIHHVEHIIDVVEGNHLTAMRGVLRDLKGDRLHRAEHDIGQMLASEAEPNLSSFMIHVQMAMAAITRQNRPEAIHHITDFLDVAAATDAIHGRAAIDALRGDQFVDAALHLGTLVRLETERQEAARRCSGDGVAHPGVQGDRIAVLLLIDEEWTDRFGALAVEHAVTVVAHAQAMVADLKIAIDVVDVQPWRSPVDGDLHELSHAASIDNPLPDDASLLLVLTDQDTIGTTDGVHSHSTGSHSIAVRHHRDQPQQDALVFAHEIGHMLDLTHEAGTYMQARGFVDNPRWSECQKGEVARLISESIS